MYKRCYYVPESYLETTKQAVFDAGAGHVGNYDSCCWQVRGEGQFRPLPDSSPFLGQTTLCVWRTFEIESLLSQLVRSQVKADVQHHAANVRLPKLPSAN